MARRPAVRILLALGAILLGNLSWAQSYGRWGASPTPVVDGFSLTKEGFRASPGAGSLLRFAEPLTGFTRKEGSDRAAEWTVQGPAGAPKAVRVHFRTPGFDLKVSESFRLQFNTTAAPLLTVADATYDGVSAPHSRWALVTFKDSQPSILFGFLDGTSNLRVTGGPGAWSLVFGPAYSGWIRVALPFGAKPLPGTGLLVSRAGAAARTLSRHALAWSRYAPRTTGFTLSRQQGQLVARWTMDRPGALIPPALVAASAVSGMVITTPFESLTNLSSFGPLALTTTQALEVRFPVRPLAQGRRLMPKQGGPAGDLRSLFAADTDPQVRTEALLTAVEGYRNAPRQMTPASAFTGFTPASVEEWLALANLARNHAVSLGAIGLPSQFNLALTTALWARDPLLLEIPGPPEAGALVASAALMSPEPERQLEGALLAAGLTARPRINQALQAAGLPTRPATALGPDLEWLTGLGATPPSWMAATFSPVRVLEGPPAWVRRSTKGWVLCWHSEGGEAQRFVLLSSYRLTAHPIGNIQRIQTGAAEGRLTVTARADRLGLCEVLIKPEGGKPMDFPQWPSS